MAMSSRPWSQSCTVLRSLPGPDQARALELLQVVGAHGGRATGSVRRWRVAVLSLPQVWRKLSTEKRTERRKEITHNVALSFVTIASALR